MPTGLELAGATPQKQPHYAALFSDRMFTGLFTQRAPLHDPSDVYTARYYGGRPDALWKGLNIELTNNMTLKRRPGSTKFSNTTYPTPPDRSYSFQVGNGSIQVIVDTGTSGGLVLTSVANTSGGSTIYTGTVSGGASNAYVGHYFAIAGFTNTVNNGTFICTASSATTLTLTNAQGVTETHAATATSSGAVFVDNQNGTKTLLFGKQPTAGQTYFVDVAGVLYMGDGVDTKKYTPLNTNGTVWKWGIDAPALQPSVVITESGSASVVWQANTVWSTMGLIYDATSGTSQQLHGVNAKGTNTSANFGTTGNGGPTWSQTPGATTSDNTITWTNRGPIVLWTANTQYQNASTGGTTANPCIIYDPKTKSCYIQANSNPGLRTSGPNYPTFIPSPGAHTNDGQVVWVWLGPGGIPGQWLSSHAYPALGTVSNNDVVSSVSEPANLTNGLPVDGSPVYWQTSGGGTSASSGAPSFQTSGNITSDGDLEWLSLGSGSWSANRSVASWSADGTVFAAIKDPNGNAQVCIRTGTTFVYIPGTAFVLSAAANAVGANTTYTGVFSTAIPAGSTVVIAGFVNSANNGTFTVQAGGSTTTLIVNNSAGVSETHAGTATYNSWGTSYGVTTVDGDPTTGPIWVCVGSMMSWAANTIWERPTPGYSPPTNSSPYGGSSVIDSNNNVEFVIDSGKGGSSQPTWNTLSGGTFATGSTTDGAATWFNLEPFTAQSITWQFGYAYGYSFKARALDDFYTVNDPLTGSPPVPPGLTRALPTPTGSETNAISSSSPAFIITGPNAGAVNTISGVGSLDPQVDTIVIWRSADGGGAGQMFELTEIPAPPPINGIPQTWSFRDFLPDTPTNTFPGLDPLTPAPIDDSNDPPPANFLPMVFNFQRIWGSIGQAVQFSGGPDVLTGNKQEAFAPADNIEFLAPVVRLVKTSQGLVTFLTNSIDVIAGGPATSSFFSVPMAPGIGLLSFNALDVYGGEIYFFSADNQFRTLSPSLNVSVYGFPLGDQFANLPSSGSSDATWNPSNVYVTVHQNGIDNCIMVADGSTGWYRLNPHQVPGSAQGPEPIWSPFAAITGGVKMVQSVETAPGIKKLLIGGTTFTKNILYRDLTVFADDSVAYPANFTMGSITLAHPGSLAVLKFLEFDFSGVNFRPVVSFLLNEIAGTFTPFTLAPQFDPPQIYGATISPTSYSPNRYYFSGTASLAWCRHMMIKVDYGTNSVGNELYSMAIFGRVLVEK